MKIMIALCLFFWMTLNVLAHPTNVNGLAVNNGLDSTAKVWLFFDLNAQQPITTLYHFDCMGDDFKLNKRIENSMQVLAYPPMQLQNVIVGKCKSIKK